MSREWTEQEAREAALKLCRGEYQRGIVEGRCRLSGSDLRGNQKQYASKYAMSRRVILKRIADAKIPCTVVVVEHGRKELRFGGVFEPDRSHELLLAPIEVSEPESPPPPPVDTRVFPWAGAMGPVRK